MTTTFNDQERFRIREDKLPAGLSAWNSQGCSVCESAKTRIYSWWATPYAELHYIELCTTHGKEFLATSIEDIEEEAGK